MHLKVFLKSTLTFASFAFFIPGSRKSDTIKLGTKHTKEGNNAGTDLAALVDMKCSQWWKIQGAVKVFVLLYNREKYTFIDLFL